MPSYTTPPTKAVGGTFTASEWNQFIRDNMEAMRPDTGIARRVAVQSIPNNTDTFITFDTEDDDTAGFYNLVANPTRLTYPYKGVFLVIAEIAFATNTTGIRAISVKRNGLGGDDAIINKNPVAGVADRIVLYTITPRLANDYHELNVFQNSGGNLDVTFAKLSVAVLRNDS